jgi:hypothetical protein
MITMKGYVQQDHLMLSGETKVFARLGYIPSSTGAAESPDEVTLETPEAGDQIAQEKLLAHSMMALG